MALSAKAAEAAAAAAEAEAKLANLKALKHEMVLQLKQVRPSNVRRQQSPAPHAFGPSVWITDQSVHPGCPTHQSCVRHQR